VGGAARETVDLIAAGSERDLRKRPPNARERSPERPAILYLPFDGVGRNVLYSMLRAGELPELARLLGGIENGKLAHAHLDDRLLSTLPSSTMAAWVTTMTGVPPGEHGVTGNEFFMRESRTLACPAPVSFTGTEPTIQIYTDGYLGSLHPTTPTVYERMRETDPDVLVWVAMHHVFRGADKLILTKKTVLVRALDGFAEVEVKKRLEDKESRRLYADLDHAVVDATLGELKSGPAPDVLTVYLSGTDLFAHVADVGPEKAQRAYLKEIVDPALGKLAERLRARGELERRFVVVTADHGHTEVLRDEQRALGARSDDGPKSVLEHAGFRVRSFKREVSNKDDFNSVIVYGGATAYVYVADRSRCANKDDVCDWNRPPRYEDDVLPAADAFFRSNADGTGGAAMKGALDVVLTRRPHPYEEPDVPFEVYVGEKKTMPLGEWLSAHPHRSYVDFEARLRDLATGKRGERAGDIMLLAHNGDRDDPKDRFYFAAPYRSWHGSPSRLDSEIPFIVAHPSEPIGPIARWVERVLADRPYQQKVTDVLLGLRESAWKKDR
jgi:hypothetical protein